MFASKKTKDLEVLDQETGGNVSVKIRKLNHVQLDSARRVRSLRHAETMRALGGEVTKTIQSDNAEKLAKQVAAARETKKTPEELRAERVAAYDRETVLNDGIVSWSDQTPVTAASIADLEESFAQDVFEAIVELSDPPKEEAEADQAKG